MSQQIRCQRCGTPLAAEGPRGHCPRCLLVLGLEAASTAGPPAAVPDPASGRPDCIGPYRILETLGEGGMGIVYHAEQTEPIHRRVAIKVIKPGMDSRQVLARFEAERQALALMDHPSIAKVFDAGVTPRGLPFFAMEFVKGEPITVYCDRQKLSTHARLDLFMRVCEGVQHAHQKGIIHRDLKPSNVMVAVQDGKPVPKIIDFGVAKATAQRLTEKTLFTEMGVLIGTPEYMSPEQAEMTGLDVDTRTDVYALGIILYELLVGALPLDITELREAGFDEIRRRIREVEPPRPSERASIPGNRSTDSARRRGTEPARLASQLRGDLDWITMKALEKDRTRRYGSPSDLAADIVRYLGNEPVLAGPPSATYQVRKFVRRHRFGVAAAVIGVVVPLAFAAAMVSQAGKTAREAEAKARVAEFLTDLFRESDPVTSRGKDITARELLDRGARKIHAALGDDPMVRVDLLMTMGSAYEGIGLYPEAEALLNDALKVCRTRRLDSHACLSAAHELNTLYWNGGRYDAAEALASEMLAARRRFAGTEDRETLLFMADLAGAYVGQRRNTEAEVMIRDALTLQKRLFGSDDPDTLSSMEVLSTLYDHQGRYVESAEIKRESYEIKKRVLGSDHPGTCNAMSSWARALAQLGRFQEADPVFRDLVAIQKSVLGPEHPSTLGTQLNLALFYRTKGRLAQAEALNRELLETLRRVLGPEDAMTLTAMIELATDYRMENRFGDAEAIDRQAFEIRKRTFGPEHPDTLQSMHYLARDYLGQGRVAEAEEQYRQVLATQRRVLGPEHQETLRSMSRLSDLYRDDDRPKEADTLNQELFDIRKRVLGAENTDTLGSMFNLAADHRALGRFKEAEAVDRELVETWRRTQGPDTPGAMNAMISLAADYIAQERYQEAEALHRELLEISTRVRGAEDRATFVCMSYLAMDARLQKRYPEAESLDRKVLDFRRRVLGSEDPETIQSLGNLAEDYRVQGRHKDAEALDREAVETGKRVFGTEHPDTLRYMNVLAIDFGAQGRHAEAETLDRKVLEIRQRVQGPEHVDTIRSLNILARDLAAQKRYRESADLFKKAADLSRRVLGPDDQRTLRSIYNLACMEMRLGDRKRAVGHLREAVEQGYEDEDGMKKDPDLAPLRNDPEFRTIVAMARQNSERAGGAK